MGKTVRVVNVPIYWLCVGIVVMLVSPVLSILASVTIANGQRTRAEAAAAKAKTESTEEARVRTCNLFSALLDAYVEQPPTTDTGRKIQQTYLSFYRLNNCQPPRSK